MRRRIRVRTNVLGMSSTCRHKAPSNKFWGDFYNNLNQGTPTLPQLNGNNIEKHSEANKAHLEFIQRLIYIELQLQRVHCVK